MNGHRLTLSNDAAYHLVMKVADGRLDSVADIAAILQTATEPRPGAWQEKERSSA
jgi:death-on-curing protein